MTLYIIINIIKDIMINLIKECLYKTQSIFCFNEYVYFFV